MEENVDSARSQDVAKSVADDASWFGEHGYRWPSAALPMAYAMACVEVACENSEKAGGLFQQIIEACGKPGIEAVRTCCTKITPIGIDDDAPRVVTATASSSRWLITPLQPEGWYPSHRLG